MRARMLCTALIGAALAVPAHAQTSSGPGQGSQSGSQQMSQGSNQGSNQAGSQGRSQQSTQQQQMLRQQLTQAGFQNVQILDTAYLVQAQTRDGVTVLMTVNPPGGGGSPMASGSGSAGAASGASGSSAPSASGGRTQ